MKRLTAFGALFLCLGTAFAQDEAAQDPQVPEMESVKTSFQETWINPNKRSGDYTKIYLWEANFEYRDVGPAQRTRTSMMHTHKREFGIAEEDRREFEKIVSEAFIEELNKIKRWEIVDEIGPGTLVLRGAVLDIISRVPPETVGRTDVYLSSVGEATLVLELIDATDGEHVAVAAERRVISGQPGGQLDAFSMPANRATIVADIRRWARRHANKLRTELDKAAKQNQ